MGGSTVLDIASNIRIFNSDPQDEFVAKRTQAIAKLAEQFVTSGKTVSQLLTSANEIASSGSENVAASLAAVVQEAIRGAGADAFVPDGQNLQISVCALLGAHQALAKSEPSSGDVTTVTVLAAGLWSALSFQEPRPEPRLEALRLAVMDEARKLTVATASASRVRAKVMNFAAPLPEEGLDFLKVRAALEETRAAIYSLRANAALDREEIDLLWWVLGDWCEALKCKYSKPDNAAAAAIACGLEAGIILRRLPAEAHRQLVLRNVGGGKSYSLAELIRALGELRSPLAVSFEKRGRDVDGCPSVFPLLYAIRSAASDHTAAISKRSTREWAERALIERAVLHVSHLLPVVV